jgi:hypothetical protein
MLVQEQPVMVQTFNNSASDKYSINAKVARLQQLADRSAPVVTMAE